MLTILLFAQLLHQRNPPDLHPISCRDLMTLHRQTFVLAALSEHREPQRTHLIYDWMDMSDDRFVAGVCSDERLTEKWNLMAALANLDLQQNRQGRKK
jgi:hypothetical protein